MSTSMLETNSILSEISSILKTTTTTNSNSNNSRSRSTSLSSNNSTSSLNSNDLIDNIIEPEVIKEWITREFHDSTENLNLNKVAFNLPKSIISTTKNQRTNLHLSTDLSYGLYYSVETNIIAPDHYKDQFIFDWRDFIEKEGEEAKEESRFLPLPKYFGLTLLGEEMKKAFLSNPSLPSPPGSPSPENEEDEEEEEEEKEFKLPTYLYKDCSLQIEEIWDRYDKKKAKEEKEMMRKMKIPREKREKIVSVEKGEKVVKEKEKTWETFRYMSRNTYHERKSDKAEIEAICQCKPPPLPLPVENEDVEASTIKEEEEIKLGCNENCINRMMQYTCSPKTCPCSLQCSNLPLHSRLVLPYNTSLGLKPFLTTNNRGFGLKSMVDIKQGELITEYIGEVITRDESYKRVLGIYKDWKSFYFLDYDSSLGEVIDAGQKGNAARFINHSCGPNCEVVRWKYSNLEEFQMGIFALEDIPAETELTYDYGWQDFNSTPSTSATSTSKLTLDSLQQEPIILNRQACYCGALQCSGWLGRKKEKEKKVEVLKIIGGKGKGKKIEVDEKKVVKEKKSSPLKKEKVVVEKEKEVEKIGKGKRKLAEVIYDSDSDESEEEDTRGGKRIKLDVVVSSSGKGKGRESLSRG